MYRKQAKNLVVGDSVKMMSGVSVEIAEIHTTVEKYDGGAVSYITAIDSNGDEIYNFRPNDMVSYT